MQALQRQLLCKSKTVLHLEFIFLRVKSTQLQLWAFQMHSHLQHTAVQLQQQRHS